MDYTWAEEFYEYAEKNLKGYKRPVDYKERVDKLLEGKRKPNNTNREGKTLYKEEN